MGSWAGTDRARPGSPQGHSDGIARTGFALRRENPDLGCSAPGSCRGRAIERGRRLRARAPQPSLRRPAAAGSEKGQAERWPPSNLVLALALLSRKDWPGRGGSERDVSIARASSMPALRGVRPAAEKGRARVSAGLALPFRRLFPPPFFHNTHRLHPVGPLSERRPPPLPTSCPSCLRCPRRLPHRPARTTSTRPTPTSSTSSDSNPPLALPPSLLVQ